MNLFFWADYLRTYEISHPYALVNIVSGLHRWVNGKNSKFFAFDSTNHVLHFHNGQLEPANKYFLNKSSIVLTYSKICFYVYENQCSRLLYKTCLEFWIKMWIRNVLDSTSSFPTSNYIPTYISQKLTFLESFTWWILLFAMIKPRIRTQKLLFHKIIVGNELN